MENNSIPAFDFYVLLDQVLLARALSDIQQAFAGQDIYRFRPASLVIVTWNNVTFTGGNPALVGNSYDL